MTSFDKSWEDLIYAKQQHINRYPYGELVSIFFNSLKYLPEGIRRNKKQLKVLELGSGAGNNLWFINELGYQVYGIDGSETACNIAKKNLKKRGASNIVIQQAYFDELPFGNDSIDLIIDRESTCCGKFSDIKRWWSEANRVLKKEGVVISFKFSDDNPSLIDIKKGKINATFIEENTYTNVDKGTFKDTGIVHFSTYNELFDLFDFLDIKFINKHDNKTIYNSGDHSFHYSEWIVVGVKK